jgi:hypothetical protein
MADISQTSRNKFPYPTTLKRTMYENERRHVTFLFNLDNEKPIYGAILGRQTNSALGFIRYSRYPEFPATQFLSTDPNFGKSLTAFSTDPIIATASVVPRLGVTPE